MPHKAQMSDWASQLGQYLFPDDPVKNAKLRMLAAADRENWQALERFLNEVAPQCFGGGSGCGVPGPQTGVTPIATGENACAEGNGTNAAGDQSVAMGLDNSIDALDPNSVIAGGDSNTITNGTNVGNNIILAGHANNIDDAEESAVGGDTCVVKSDQALAYGSGVTIDTGAQAAVALGYSLTVTDEGVSAATVLGSNAVAYQSGQLAHSSGFGNFFTVNGLIRATNQESLLVASVETLDATPHTMGFIFADVPYAVSFRGQVVAKRHNADVVSCWEFKGLYASDGAGGFRLVGSSTTMLFQDAGAAAWAAAVVTTTASSPNDWLSIQVTGAAATTIDWTASWHFTEALGGY